MIGEAAELSINVSERHALILNARELVDRFYGLPVSRKAELIDRFRLLKPEDFTLSEADQLNLALLRARDTGQLVALARAIVDIEG